MILLPTCTDAGLESLSEREWETSAWIELGKSRIWG